MCLEAGDPRIDDRYFRTRHIREQSQHFRAGELRIHHHVRCAPDTQWIGEPTQTLLSVREKASIGCISHVMNRQCERRSLPKEGSEIIREMNDIESPCYRPKKHLLGYD